MFKLSNLAPTTKKRKRIGRGGSRGGTSGRGHKGQKARSGSHSMRAGFEGGQMPLTRRLPRRGFTNAPFRVEIQGVSLADLEKKFDEGAKINHGSLVEKGLIKRSVRRVKVLGGHELKKKLIIEADAFSKSAKDAVEKVGGEAIVSEG